MSDILTGTTSATGTQNRAPELSLVELSAMSSPELLNYLRGLRNDAKAFGVIFSLILASHPDGRDNKKMAIVLSPKDNKGGAIANVTSTIIANLRSGRGWVPSPSWLQDHDFYELLKQCPVWSERECVFRAIVEEHAKAVEQRLNQDDRRARARSPEKQAPEPREEAKIVEDFRLANQMLKQVLADRRDNFQTLQPKITKLLRGFQAEGVKYTPDTMRLLREFLNGKRLCKKCDVICVATALTTVYGILPGDREGRPLWEALNRLPPDPVVANLNL